MTRNPLVSDKEEGGSQARARAERRAPLPFGMTRSAHPASVVTNKGLRAYTYGMETSYCELHRKEAVNLTDGKRLGRVSDVVFTYPEGRVQGIVVPGGRGFRWGRAEIFIDLKCIKKIGVDVILVDIRSAPKPEKRANKWGNSCSREAQFSPSDRRDYGDYE